MASQLNWISRAANAPEGWKMTRLAEQESVVLTINQPTHGIEAGTRGKIVMVYDSTPPGIYEVEFVLDRDDRLLRITCSGNELAQD